MLNIFYKNISQTNLLSFVVDEQQDTVNKQHEKMDKIGGKSFLNGLSRLKGIMMLNFGINLPYAIFC